jgi:hypothetical protein
MNESIDEAIEKLLGSIRTNIKSEDAVKFSQAALNLAQVKQILHVVGLGTKSKGAG